MVKNNEIFRVSYTNKDIMDKLDKIYTEVKVTNGKVKLHSKVIMLLGGMVATMVGYLIKLAILI